MRHPIVVAPEAENLRRYTRVRFPELSDRELAQYNFQIDDPTALGNLSEEEPPVDQDLTFVGQYKVAENVKCVFGHLHKWGFVFSDEEGRHYLIGNECGAKLLGVTDWRDFDRRQRSMSDRASYLRQLFALKAVLAEQRDWIESLAKSPSLVAFHDIRADIAEYPELVDAARKVFSRNGGELSLTTTYRDHDAEGRREEQEDQRIAEFEKKTDAEKVQLRRAGHVPRRSTAPIMKEQLVGGGTLVGRVLFAAQPSATEDYMNGLVKRIDGFLALEKMPAEKKTVQAISQNMRDLVQRLIGVRDDINDAIAFFEQENLERFAVWADQKRFDYCNFRIGDRFIEIEDIDGGERDYFIAPDTLKSLDNPRFDLLREASMAFALQFDAEGR